MGLSMVPYLLNWLNPYTGLIKIKTQSKLSEPLGFLSDKESFAQGGQDLIGGDITFMTWTLPLIFS